MLTCDVSKSNVCVFFFAQLLWVCFSIALSLRCDNNVQLRSSLFLSLSLILLLSCFELIVSLCLPAHHIGTCDIFQIDRNRLFSSLYSWKITLHSRQKKQSVTIRGKSNHLLADLPFVCLSFARSVCVRASERFNLNIVPIVYRFFMVVIASHRVRLLAIHWELPDFEQIVR